jgi:hypothetical protein
MVKTDTLAGPEFNLEMPLGNCPDEGNPDGLSVWARISKGPEAREEDEFEQVSGPVNQPEPRNPMNPEEFRIGEDSCSGEDPLDSNSQERARRS